MRKGETSCGAVEVGFEEEFVVGVKLPEDGEDALVGEEHLPDGLDPAHSLIGGQGVGAELLGEHGLPGVELEDRMHLILAGIEEGLGVIVPADLLHEHLNGVESGLLGGVAEVDEGELVFGVVETAEVKGLLEVGEEVFPLRNELVVDGVELVGVAAVEGVF